MKYNLFNLIIILFLAMGCTKEVSNISSESNIKSATLLDTIANCKWVFTEYHDKVTYQTQSDSIHFINRTNFMSIISDGNETAKIDINGKMYLNRDYDFSFAKIDYFNSSPQPYSFVNNSYTEPYSDTANYNLDNNSIILSRHVKYLPDTMAIINVDNACLILSGILHANGYDVKRSIVFYKNTRWYGGYRNYSWL